MGILRDLIRYSLSIYLIRIIFRANHFPTFTETREKRVLLLSAPPLSKPWGRFSFFFVSFSSKCLGIPNQSDRVGRRVNDKKKQPWLSPLEDSQSFLPPRPPPRLPVLSPKPACTMEQTDRSGLDPSLTRLSHPT